jgi:hypothetical protein
MSEQTPSQSGTKPDEAMRRLSQSASRAMDSVSSSLSSIFTQATTPSTTPRAPSTNVRPGIAGQRNPEDIPREELMHVSFLLPVIDICN